MKELTTDEVFDAVGHLGRGQLLYMAIISLLTFFMATHMVLNIFTGLEPHFTCIATSGIEGLPYTDKSSQQTPFATSSSATIYSNSYSSTKLNSSRSLPSSRSSPGIPSVSFYSSSSVEASRIKRDEGSSAFYRQSSTLNPTANDGQLLFRGGRSPPERVRETTEGISFPVEKRDSVTETHLRDQCPDNDPYQCRILYDSGFQSIVQEWGLVCREKQSVAEVQAAWMTGVMAGALLLSQLPDMYGRTSTLLIATLTTVAFEGMASFTDNFTVYVVLRPALDSSPSCFTAVGRGHVCHGHPGHIRTLPGDRWSH